MVRAMGDRSKTIAALIIIVGIVLIATAGILRILGGNKIVSPIPDESAIKIIFISPTPVPIESLTPSAVQTPTP